MNVGVARGAIVGLGIFGKVDGVNISSRVLKEVSSHGQRLLGFYRLARFALRSM
jgi:hypothetical protein